MARGYTWLEVHRRHVTMRIRTMVSHRLNRRTANATIRARRHALKFICWLDIIFYLVVRTERNVVRVFQMTNKIIFNNVLIRTLRTVQNIRLVVMVHEVVRFSLFRHHLVALTT